MMKDQIVLKYASNIQFSNLFQGRGQLDASMSMGASSMNQMQSKPSRPVPFEGDHEEENVQFQPDN